MKTRVNYKNNSETAKEKEIREMAANACLEKFRSVKNFIKASDKTINNPEIEVAPAQQTLCTLKQLLTSEGLTITGAIKKMQASLKGNRVSLKLPAELMKYKAIDRNKTLIDRMNASAKEDKGIAVFNSDKMLYAYTLNGQMLVCWTLDENSGWKTAQVPQRFNRVDEIDFKNSAVEEMQKAAYQKYGVEPVALNSTVSETEESPAVEASEVENSTAVQVAPEAGVEPVVVTTKALSTVVASENANII